MSTATATLPGTYDRETAVPDQGFRPFGKILRDLLIERDITTGMGNPNWSAFSTRLETSHYESLRKAVTGERQPTPKLMEEAADALSLDPGIFVEYRVWQAQRQFDPREVGSEKALENLERWAKFQRGGRK